MSDVSATALLSSMSDGVYLVDRDRRIVSWNPAATRLTGYSAERAVGRFCGDGLLNHVDSDGRQLCGGACPLLATLTDGQIRSCRVYLHHADGHMVPVRVTAAAMRDTDGAITGVVETFGDDAETVALHQRLTEARAQASTDPLTGLGNRRAITDAADHRFSAWRADGQPFALVLIDVDGFKQINDRLGHDAGDRALRIVSETLRLGVRPQDEVFRLGGDEFAVLTGAITPTGLIGLVVRLRSLVRESRFDELRDSQLHVTVSVGVATVAVPDDLVSLNRRADQLLLRAKRCGRDRAVLPDPTIAETDRLILQP